MSVLDRLLRRGAADVVVEPMRRRHLAAVMPIEDVSYPKPWGQTVFAGELEQARRGERTYLVARRHGRLLGYGGMMYAVDDAHVTNIAVNPDERRTGVGTRLLAELAWVAVERGCTALTLEVRVSNVGAQALYRRFGFAPAGVRQRYYENSEDAIVMWCHDIQSDEYRRRLAELSPEAAR